jgi:hypothetical protein
VIDAEVELVGASGDVAFRARTDNHGRAELFAGIRGGDDAPYRVRATAGLATGEVDVPADGGAPVAIDLPRAAEAAPSVDLMFVVDTTGSMGDELWYIQAELGNVIERAQSESTQRFELRTSVNFYRDSGDEYVVRDYAFTTDHDASVAQMARQSAGGGGDWPEAVDRAVANAIDEHTWSESARARILFLVLDAPPHPEQSIEDRLARATLAAAEHGVRIVPVSGTGVDTATEHLLRTLAITTNGTYAFLTNHSGIGGDHLDPDVPSYEVEYLDDLMVRVIVEAAD